MTKPFTVALLDASGLPAAQRIAAEVRYIREIERALGGEDEVAQVYQAWKDASEAEASQLSSDTAALAVRWPRAAEAAVRAGFRELGDLGEAYFEVRLDRPQAHAR